jgi:hypothetical protein
MRIEVNVPDGISGDWEVSTFTVDKEAAKWDQLRAAINGNNRGVEPGTYKRLTYKNEVVASNTPAEVRDVWEPIHQAKLQGGHVLINGLGLGMIMIPILEHVEKITVIELSQEVIDLVSPTYNDPKIEIIKHDALTFQPNGMRFTVVWHDIWNDICTDNLSDMHKLHRKYGRRCDWQGSWAKYICEQKRREDKRWESQLKMFISIGKHLSGSV